MESMNWSKSAGSLARGVSGASFLRRGDENFPCAMVVVSFYRQGIVGAASSRPKADGIARLAEWEQLSAPTVGGGNHGVVPFNEQTPPPHVRSAPFNSGMIATGNHNFEKFAALCNTLSGEARVLRTSGVTLPIPHSLLLITYAHAGGRCRAGSGTDGLVKSKSVKIPTVYEWHVTGRVREPMYRYRVRSVVGRAHCALKQVLRQCR